MKKQNVIQKALIVMAVLISQNCLASTVIQLTSQDIINRAQYIVSGHVESIYTAIEKANMPFQYITIEVATIYKNNADEPLYEGAKVVLRQIGGEKDGMTLDVGSLPKFAEKDEVVVNLKKDKNGYYYVVGNAQGLYKKTGNMLINNTQEEGTIFATQGNDGEIKFEPGKVKKISMDEMVAKINRINEEQ